MKIIAGKIKPFENSETVCDGIKIESERGELLIIYEHDGSLFTSRTISKLDDFDEYPIDTSRFLPKITDYFPKNIASIMVTFKEDQSSKGNK